MVMTGEADLRTPIGQSEEFYKALKMQKKETVLVRMPDEFHGWRRPSHRLMQQLYLLAWFEKHKKGCVDEHAELERWRREAWRRRSSGSGTRDSAPYACTAIVFHFCWWNRATDRTQRVRCPSRMAVQIQDAWSWPVAWR